MAKVERLARRVSTREAAVWRARRQSTVQQVARLWMSRMAARQVVPEAQCFGEATARASTPRAPPPRCVKRWQQRAGVEAIGWRWWRYGTRLQRQTEMKSE